MPEQLESGRRADNVHDRVDRADFVKVHLLNRHAVNERLGFPQPPENAGRPFGDRQRQPCSLNQLKNFGE